MVGVLPGEPVPMASAALIAPAPARMTNSAG
jgi:hypothetical protein